MHVIMTDKQVSVHFDNNPHVESDDLNYIWTIVDFEAEFGVTAPDKLVSLNYEPDRSLYVMSVKGDNVGDEYIPHVFQSPSEHPVLNWIETNLDTIRQSAEYHVLKQDSEYPGDDYTWNPTSEQWVKIEDPNKDTVIAERWLAGHAKEIAVALSYLWDAAEAKNVFDGVTVPQAVTDTIATIRNHRDKIG